MTRDRCPVVHWTSGRRKPYRCTEPRDHAGPHRDVRVGMVLMVWTPDHREVWASG